MEQIKARLKELKNKRWAMPAAGIGFSILVALLVHVVNGEPVAESYQEESIDIATLIPAGFSLVNVTVKNPEAVESMIQQYGVVDIYAKGGKKPLAEGVRMLRMPGQPMEFGVLVPEHETARIIQENDEPFHVSLQSQEKPMNFAAEAKTSRRIIVED